MYSREKLSLMLFRLFSLAAPVIAAPTAAAAVVVNIDHVEVSPGAQDQTVYLDVYLVDLVNENERMTAYGVVIDGPLNAPDGVRFVDPAWAPPSPRHPDAFRDARGGLSVGQFVEYDAIAVGGEVQSGLEVNVSESYSGLFSFPVLVPGGVAPGTYPAVIRSARLTGGGPNIDVVLGPPGGVTVLPEPAVGATALMGLAMLRWRRAATKAN